MFRKSNILLEMSKRFGNVLEGITKEAAVLSTAASLGITQYLQIGFDRVRNVLAFPKGKWFGSSEI